MNGQWNDDKIWIKKKTVPKKWTNEEKKPRNKNKQNIWKATRFFIFCAAFVSGWLKEKWK